MVLATTVLATVLDTDTDTVSATPDTTDTVSATTDTTARGLLMLSPPLSLRPRLMPIPTTDTTAMDTVLDTPVTDTVLDTTTDTVLATTARGPLRPSPPLMLMPRLIPTTDTTATDTTVLDTAPTVATTDTATAMACTDTTVKCPADSSQPKTSLGITSSSSEKWIAQFGLIPTSATSFSATRLAQARNGEQEAKENQNVLIRRIKKLKPKK